jgi:hypothetical protein
VAGSAIIHPALAHAVDGWKTAPVFSVTFQTAFSVKGRLLFRCGQLVGIVTRDAAELAGAPNKALTLMHLLDLADEAVLLLPLGLFEHCPERLKGQARPKILFAAAGADNSVITD